MASSPSLNRTIGRYEVARQLGQGAMGRVLLARDPVLNRDVAIKVLRDDLGIPPELRDSLLERMRHEAQAAARVSHPNIVTLHDMGEDESVGLYLVFEYVAGANLKERLKTGRLPPTQAARLARELGAALAIAHLAGVLHRDVKPENVMLSPSGAKVADFGIAKIPDSTLTRTGTLVGTPAYCAPEALASGAFSPESDQFSLAATLYEAVSGERAFPGEDAVGVAAKIATEEARPIARKLGLPDELDAVLLRGLSKDPSLRFASTAELGEAFATAVEGARASLTSVSSIMLAPVTEPRPIARAASAPPPGDGSLRIGIGAATIAIVSAFVGFAASRGTPFFPAPIAPIVSATAAVSAPSATATAVSTPTHAYHPRTPAPAPTPSATTSASGAHSAAVAPSSAPATSASAGPASSGS